MPAVQRGVSLVLGAIPSPTDASGRASPSRLPTHTTFSSDGAMAIEPIDPVG
jgi:hypothetical protein